MEEEDGLTQAQRLAFSLETLNAARFIRAGVDELWNLTSTYDFYLLPLQSLSQGFERLFKLTIALARHNNGLAREVKPTHDVYELARTASEEVGDAVELQTALDDPHIERMLKILTAFGQHTRYHDLDEFLGKPHSDDSPEQAWQRLELESFKASYPDDWAQRLEGGDYDEVFATIAADMSTLVVRVAGSLARIWARGAVGRLARIQTPYLSQFLPDAP